jgi:hypothetical protein
MGRNFLLVLIALEACQLSDLTAAHAQSSASGQTAINLICYGQGEKPAATTSYGYEWDRREQRYRYRDRTQYGTDQFDTFVTVQINGDQGRIRLPKRLIPPINSGGSERWWDLENLQISLNEIRGRYRMNGLNKPKVVIDRMSGEIAIDGIEHFNGRCNPVDAGMRRF